MSPSVRIFTLHGIHAVAVKLITLIVTTWYAQWEVLLPLSIWTAMVIKSATNTDAARFNGILASTSLYQQLTIKVVVALFI